MPSLGAGCNSDFQSAPWVTIFFISPLTIYTKEKWPYLMLDTAHSACFNIMLAFNILEVY
jgi:hypothetical protein